MEQSDAPCTVRPVGVRVGTSGWMYRSWRGGLYPERLPQRCWFDHDASEFDTVELNATFYRLPTLETAAGWAAAAPPGFEYSVKLAHPYHGRYGPRRLRRWVARIEAWVGDGIGVRAYFNNDVEGAAVRDARWLRDAVVAAG